VISRSLSRLSLVALVVGMSTSCAEERDPINRVGPHALDKSFFVGPSLSDPSDDPEFYWRSYVVDGGMSQSLIGIGSWSGVERIRWVVDRDYLYAHRSYQWIEGGDDKGVADKTPQGTLLAVYAIESHFDIRREYNPSTGEELNVVVENTSDRPWYARQYMRVDWSQNLIQTPVWDDMFIGRMFGRIELEPVVDEISDPSHPDAIHFEPDAGYFDITQRYWIRPADSWYFPGIPTCHVVGIFTGSATYECDSQLAVVRSSFLRIDQESDFEPLEITRHPGDIVGNPAAIDPTGLLVGMIPPGKQGWDPGYGFTDALYHRFAHIHDVWQKSHIEVTCAVNDDLDGDGTADACHPSITGYDGSLGSQCDVHKNKCTIPYRDRAIRTSGYWVNPEMPDELLDPLDDAGNPLARGPSEDVVYAWNQLMQNAVALAREVECRRTGGDRDACHEELFHEGDQMVSYGAWLIGVPRDETPVLTLCHNPVRSYDLSLCGAVGARARLGDIRKNFLAYWPYASRVPWGGIGNWGADPLSGEIRGAAAMIMGRSATRAAAHQRDVIQLVLGDVTIEDIIEGAPAEMYAHLLENGGKTPEALSSEEIARRLASIDADHAKQTLLPAAVPGATMADKAATLAAMEKDATADVGRLSSAQAEFEALASTLRGTLYEAQLVDGSWLNAVAGMSPGAVPGDDLLAGVSPLRGLDPGWIRAAQERIETMMHIKGVCFGEHHAPILGSLELPGLARYFDEKYPLSEYDVVARGELIYRDLWIEAYKGIAIHEVGHSLGLLHNFASSWDSANYHPQYWQLRTHDGASTASCQGVPRTGDTASVESDHCMGPRYLDPETDDELGLAGESRPSITYFGNTSVMEYTLERFGETVGLGQYDSHAMKALYGRVLETFEDADRGGLSPEEQLDFAPRLETQLTEMDRVVRTDGPFAGQRFAKPTHYTELARRMKVFDEARCRKATEAEKEQAAWRIVHDKVCAPAPRDHAAWIDFESGETQPGVASSQAPAFRTKTGTRTGEGDVRWFHRYGSTYHPSYFHTQLTDAGADAYEVTKNTVEAFEQSYPFRYFRNQQREFFVETLPFAASRGTFERLRAYHWNAANRNAFYRSLGEPIWNEISNHDDWHRPALLAETEMFNALASVILAPEPGAYGPMSPQPVGSERTIFDAGATTSLPFEVDITRGRFIGASYNSDPDGGGSWNYLHWMEHAGFGAEKVFAAMALADGRPVLTTISRDNYLDGRAVKINFRNDMPRAVDRLIGGVLAEDWETVGMFVDDLGAPVPEMTPILSEVVTRSDQSRVLFPNVGYRQQLGVLIFGHVYARMNGDLSLSNKLRLWIDGQLGEVTIPEAQQIRFYDPTSGYSYVARKYGSDEIDGKIVDAGIASRMVDHANQLLELAYAVELDEDGNTLRDAFGTPVLASDAEGLPIVVDGDAAGELSRYVALMDAARQIAQLVGYGPL
jgi:hypothetical protein